MKDYHPNLNGPAEPVGLSMTDGNGSSDQCLVGRRELEPRVDRTATGPLAVVPMTLVEANALVGRLHRHHQPVPGAKFCIGIADESGVRGVAVVGRPVSRHADDGWTLEVNRVCTDGVKNGCSMLYGAAWRAARAMGYRKLITYTLPEEGGVSLKAAGWRMVGEAGGGNWSRGSRPRVDDAPTQTKKPGVFQSWLPVCMFLLGAGLLYAVVFAIALLWWRP